MHSVYGKGKLTEISHFREIFDQGCGFKFRPIGSGSNMPSQMFKIFSLSYSCNLHRFITNLVGIHVFITRIRVFRPVSYPTEKLVSDPIFVKILIRTFCKNRPWIWPKHSGPDPTKTPVSGSKTLLSAPSWRRYIFADSHFCGGGKSEAKNHEKKIEAFRNLHIDR